MFREQSQAQKHMYGRIPLTRNVQKRRVQRGQAGAVQGGDRKNMEGLLFVSGG